MSFRRIAILPGALLALHILWSWVMDKPVWFRDHLLYNFIWILILIVATQAPLEVDRLAVALISLAIFSWGLGSLFASFNEFGGGRSYFQLASQLLYSLFYPLILLAIPRLAGRRKKLNAVETLDAIIFGLGFTSLFSTLLIATIFKDSYLPELDQFFLILFPLGDIALLLSSLFIIVHKNIGGQALSLLSGLTIFTVADIYYLYLATHHRYSFGNLIDDGWLIAIVLIGISLHQSGSSEVSERTISPVLIALSIFISPVLLAVSAIRPGLIPIYVLIPCIANLLLAFIRMSGAIKEAKSLTDERLLARTDELTGLPNRRKLIVEIDNFSTLEGALLLMDLNEFKPVNDLYGHEMGDLLLREVAKRFNQVMPDGDVLARLGGDEFGALIKGDNEKTIEVAHALAAALSYPFRIKNHTISIGVSIGHCFNDGGGRLLERADLAMYQAKRGSEVVVSSSRL